MDGTVIVNIFIGFLAILQMVAMVVVPILIIRWLIKKHKRWKNQPRNYKVISIPLLILNAVPTFIVCMYGLVGGDTWSEQFERNVEIWMTVFLIAIVIEIIVTFIQCKWSGIWISVVRIIVGTLVGGLAAYAFIFAVIIIALLMMADGSGGRVANSINIYRDGETRRLRPVSAGNNNAYYDEDSGESYYVTDDGRAINQETGKAYDKYWD